METHMLFMRVETYFLMLLKLQYFYQKHQKEKKRPSDVATQLKILTTKQMHQRLRK